MCNIINSFGSWIESNAVALAALVVAVVAVRVAISQARKTIEIAKWQVEQTIKQEQLQAIAEQRYAIFQQLDLLLLYYGAIIHRQQGGGILAAYSLDPKEIRRKILILLTSPTQMEKNEIKSILGAVSSASRLSDEEAMTLIKTLHGDLIKVLKPEITSAMEELNRQEN